MRRLLRLIAMLCLLTGLVGGTLLHAAERIGTDEATGATEWQHSDGCLDQVPPDADKKYPHHHGVCHGHDLAAPMIADCAPAAYQPAAAVRPAAVSVPTNGPPDSLLRPPIA